MLGVTLTCNGSLLAISMLVLLSVYEEAHHVFLFVHTDQWTTHLLQLSVNCSPSDDADTVYTTGGDNRTSIGKYNMYCNCSHSGPKVSFLPLLHFPLSIALLSTKRKLTRMIHSKTAWGGGGGGGAGWAGVTPVARNTSTSLALCWKGLVDCCLCFSLRTFFTFLLPLSVLGAG